jgi:hypothetical protein
MSSQSSHPYTNYEGTVEWSAIDKALRDLALNRDLVETTKHEYIVGYLCKALAFPETVVASPSPEDRRKALHAIREAVKGANPSNRDLVEELIQERRLEAQHG